MDEFAESLERLRARMGSRFRLIMTGMAKEVTDTSCTVSREGLPDLLEVRLNAIDDDLQSFATIVPKEGSEVLVGIVEGQKAEAVVISCSEVEKVIWKCGDTQLLFDKDGYTMKRRDESLKKILDNILDEVLKLTVPTSTGPSGTPINAAAFTQIKQRLPNLFKA
jgi:hypothetical protein